MRKKPWRRRFYIDLQAGPGKNIIETTGEIILGSPLLALTNGAGYTDYRFVEQADELAQALRLRAEKSGKLDSKSILVGDCNQSVSHIVSEIQEIDSPFIEGQWHSLSLAVFDPEGLELEWTTVSTLAQLRYVDLIINFSTGGLSRAIGQALQSSVGGTLIDRFLGMTEWRGFSRKPDGSLPINDYLEAYKQRLEDIGFMWGTEVSVPLKTTYGVELYRLLFASKHQLGVDLWEESRKRGPDQLSLF